MAQFKQSATLSADSRYSIELTVTENIPSNYISTNQTNVTYTLTATKSGGTGYYDNSPRNNVSVWINGSNVYNQNITYNFRGSTPKTITLASGSVNGITHNNDGTKTIGVSGSFTDPTGDIGSATVSGNLALTNIPRWATMNSASDFDDEQNPSFTYSNPANTSMSCWIEPKPSGEHLAIRDFSGTGGTYTWTLTEEERNQIRAKCVGGSSTYKCRLGLYSTLSGQRVASYKDVNITIKNGEPIFSDYDFEDVNPITLALTGSSQDCINGYSSIKATIYPQNAAIPQKGASILKYRFEIGDKSEQIPYLIKYTCDGTETGNYYFTYVNTYYQFTMPTVSSGDEIIYNVTKNELKLDDTLIPTTSAHTGTEIQMTVAETSFTITNAPLGKFTVYAEDNRSKSKPVEKLAINEINYKPLDFDKDNSYPYRDNEGKGAKGYLKYKGKIWAGDFGEVNNEIVSATYQFKKTDSNEWLTGITNILPALTPTETIPISEFNFNNSVDSDNSDGKFDLDASYNFKIIIEDKLSIYSVELSPMASSIPNISINKNGVGIMCDYDTSKGGALQVGGNTNINGSLSLNDKDISFLNDVRTYSGTPITFTAPFDGIIEITAIWSGWGYDGGRMDLAITNPTGSATELQRFGSSTNGHNTHATLIMSMAYYYVKKDTAYRFDHTLSGRQGGALSSGMIAILKRGQSI